MARAKKKKKRILFWLAILGAGLLLSVMVFSLLLLLVVNRQLVISKLESALNRRITVTEVKTGMFASVAGLRINGVRVSNFVPPKRLPGRQGKPVEARDLFMEIRSLTIRVNLLPLLFKKLELRELRLTEPYLRLIRFGNDATNVSDLLGDDRDRQPLTAADLPLRFDLVGISMKQATVDYENRQTRQTTRFYDLDLRLPRLVVDPQRLAERNVAQLLIRSGVKSMGEFRSGGLRSFDLSLAAQAVVKPFAPQTGQFDPEIDARVESRRGSVKGIKILASIRSIAALTSYFGKLDFIKPDLEWDNGRASIQYQQDQLVIRDGFIQSGDTQFTFSGRAGLSSGTIDLVLGVLLAASHTPEVRASIEKNVSASLPAEIGKTVSAAVITDQVMRQLVNDAGRIYLEFNFTGSGSRPHPRLLRPKLPRLEDLIAALVRDYWERNRQHLIEQGEKALGDWLNGFIKDRRF